MRLSTAKRLILLGGASPFTPDRLPGLAAWYSADFGVLNSIGPDVAATDGQQVRRWLDRSGNERHLNQPTLLNQPLLSGGGLSVSSGSAWIGSTTLSFGSSGVRGVMLHVTPFSHASNRYIVTGASTGLISESTIGQRGVVGSGQIDLFAGSAWSPNLVIPTNSGSVVDGLFGGSLASRLNVSGADVAATPGSSLLNNSMFLFATGNGTGQFFGRINEVIVGLVDWPLEDRTKVRKYLARKWG